MAFESLKPTTNSTVNWTSTPPVPQANPNAPVASSPLEIHKEKPLLRLDLGGGQTPADGFECVDYWPGAKHVVNLMKFPWLWENQSVDELYSSHFIEHIPMCYVSPSGEYKHVPEITDKDLMLAFFDECWRILKNDCRMTIICPCGRHNRGFQDPTHRRFIVAELSLYLTRQWREANKLNHYNVCCNFDVSVEPSVTQDMTLLHPEAAARRFNESWNVVSDWRFILTRKP